MEQTEISNLDPLADNKNLRLLFCDRSPVSSLRPLANLPELRKVYCDETEVSQVEANQFMQNHPRHSGCL